MGLSGVALCGIDNNTFVQIGSAGLIALACKNAVLRGMLGVTTCSLFLTPVFYYVLQSVSSWRQSRRAAQPEAKAPPVVSQRAAGA
jgi:multidrug efflux pump subunit AcrB